MMKDFEIYGYHITNDSSFMDEQNAMTSELKDQLGDLYNIALKGKKSGIKKFHRLIEKYPKNPQLKNYLSVLYKSMGNIEKSKEVNHWIVAEHPDYFFGKLNLAFELYYKEEYEKMPEILGENLDLKTLYPERNTFHIIEVIAMLKSAVFYYGAIGDIDQAEIRLNIMKELEPDSLDYEQASNQLIADRMKLAAKRFEKEQKKRIEVVGKEQLETEKTDAPKFNHQEVEWLYQYDIDLSSNHIQTILNLPHKTLISDLELILDDSIARYSYFTRDIDEKEIEEETLFVLHSIFFLTELKATESLPKVLHVLSQSEDYLEFFLGDFLTEIVWEALFKLGSNNFELLKQFMLKPTIYTYSKSEVVEAVSQTALHHPKRREDALKWFESIFNFYLNSKIEDNIIDSEVIGMMVADVIDITGKELLPLIKKLYDKEFVSVSCCGTFEDVQFAFTDNEKVTKRELLGLEERYKQIASSWASYKEEDSLLSSNKNEILPINSDKKIGRNDLCPCGSGKKYKKCCLH